MSNIPTNKTLAKAIMIFGGVQFLTILATVIRTKVAAETVGPMGVGLSSLFLSVTSFVATAASLGISTSSIQTLSKIHSEGNIEEERREIALLRLWECLSGGLGMLAMIITSPILCKVYFGDYLSHLHSILMLSIVPPATIIIGIEGAILKALQRTRMLTFFLTMQALVSVVVSIPLYITMGWNGIPIIIALQAFINAILSLALGLSVCDETPAWHYLHNLKTLWSASRPMLTLGFAFIISGLCVTSQELIMQSYINTVSSLFFVGLYKSGYQLAITYPGMIFTAIDNDYYPRLTAIGDNKKERNTLIKRQMKVLTLITTPCILCFIALLPWIVPLFLSSEFTELIPMVSFGALAVIVRAVYLPLAYMPLALGRSKDFIHLEIVSALAFVVFAIAGCKLYDLTGIGISFIVSQTFDLIYVYFFCKRKYGF